MNLQRYLLWVGCLVLYYVQKAEQLTAQDPCSSKTTCSDCSLTENCAWCYAASFNNPTCFTAATKGCVEATMFKRKLRMKNIISSGYCEIRIKSHDVFFNVTAEPSTVIPETTKIIETPEDKLREVLRDLETIIKNDSAPVFLEDLDSTFESVENIIKLDENLIFPNKFLQLLDQIGSKVGRSGSQVRDNIAMVAADAGPDNPVLGLRIARDREEFNSSAFEIVTCEAGFGNMSVEANEAIVRLPASLASSSRRISFVVFRNDRAFHTNQTTHSVNSIVLSINIENITSFMKGQVFDIYMRPTNNNPSRNQRRACAYWQFSENGGFWSTDGCSFIRARDPNILDTCRCNHLSHFAEVLITRTMFSERNEHFLQYLSMIGLFLSLFGLAIIAVTAILFKSWRRDFTNKIWLQLCISITILAASFLVIVFSDFTESNIICMLTGVFLHYAVLASFCWMLVAAILSYRRLVIVFVRDPSRKLLKAAMFSWGTPFAVVGVLLSVDPLAYSDHFIEKTPSAMFCYPSGTALWLAVYTPIAAIILVNWFFFALILRSVFRLRKVRQHEDKNDALRCTSVSSLLVFLFGLPWLFGLFAFNIVAAYLFTIFTTIQGFILFVLIILANKRTRDLWFQKLYHSSSDMVIEYHH